MIKKRKNTGTCRVIKEKPTQVKMTTQENKPESTGERKKIKEISRQGKIKQTKQDILKP